MSNSDTKEDHVNDNGDDGDHDSDQQQLVSRKEDVEFIDKIDGDDGDVDQKKVEEIIKINVTTDDDNDKKQQQLGDGLSSTQDDENDGFRTPTSLEHRIPVPTQCPPAPKKNIKRKFEESSITEIIRSATKAIRDQFMVFKKSRQNDDALS